MPLPGKPPPLRPGERLLPEALRGLGPEEVLVNELFTSIQGESTRAGRPCFFIRLTGCPLRCVWCDTEYAFFEGTPMAIDAVVEHARRSACRLVELTGGEPLIQKAAAALLARLCDAGFEVLVETSGAVDFRKIDARVAKIVDVKCPSSGMASHNLPDLARIIGPNDEIKLVIGDRADFDWARDWLRAAFPDAEPPVPVHFSPVHGRCSLRELADWVLEHRLPVRVGVQLHKLIWPEAERGF